MTKECKSIFGRLLGGLLFKFLVAFEANQGVTLMAFTEIKPLEFLSSSVGERDLPSFTMVTIVLSEDSLF